MRDPELNQWNELSVTASIAVKVWLAALLRASEHRTAKGKELCGVE